MDRSKLPPGIRGAKGKITQHPPDLYALGVKQAPTSRDSEVKRPGVSSHSKLTSSAHSGLSTTVKERKREATTSSLTSAPASKKPKVFPSIAAPTRPVPSVIVPSAAERYGVPTVSSPPVTEHWESLVTECEEGELAANVLNAIHDSHIDKAVGYLLGGLKLLRGQRYKPDPVLMTSIGFIAKVKPSLFRNEDVTQAVFTLLRRDSASTFKSKGNPQVPTFAVNLLMKGYEDVQSWPQSFFKYYLEDSIGDRIWVDHELSLPFVDNMQATFNTKVPTKQLLQPELAALAGNRADTGSPLTINDDDISETGSNKKRNILEKCNIAVYPRYSHSVEFTEQMVLEAAKDHIARRPPPETVTKNFIRFLSSASGLVEIRLLAVSRLEMWLHNAKLMRTAQDLLVYLCYNSVAETQRDVEIISHLIKIRFKTKALVNVFLNSLREMVATHEENLPIILKHTIYNELSNSRNPNNMTMVAVLFQTSPEPATNMLAEIFLELLLNKDDYLRPLRALFREIVRILRYDLDMYVFIRALIRERKENATTIRDFEFRERMFVSVADLICLCIFLAVTPSVKEAANLLTRGDRKEINTLQKFQTQISKIQTDSLWWLHETVPRIYRPNPQDFINALRKILLLDPVEQYCKQDMWPSENERNTLMRICTEVPLSQGTMIRILLIGLSKEHPLQQLDTLEFCDPLVKRAAAQPNEDGLPMLQFDKLDIIDLIFNLCTYHHPENITLPPGYVPPQLAISSLYWKGWIMLLILAAHNPTTFGNAAWEKYPTLRIFMEMCITNHFTYPPPTMAMCDNYEELKSKELQISAIEKQQILEFESHLAAASTKIAITEANSLLLPQLITMAPTGVSRRPPANILEQLRTLNTSHRLGHLICRSRRPDFLLDIITRQGPSQHMPWLAELVQSSQGCLGDLPVQCLCEFLLSCGYVYGEKSDRLFRQKHEELVTHLHDILTSPSDTATSVSEVLEYIMRRMGSAHYTSRVAAIKGIRLVLQPLDEELLESDVSESVNEGEPWLMRQLPSIPHFASVRQQITTSLRQACQVENDPFYTSSYIRFLEQHSDVNSYPEMMELVMDMAQLIVERSTIIGAILPVAEDNNPQALQTLSSLMVIFSAFLMKAREVGREALSIAETPEQILIQWSDGVECVIHVLVAHAMIILLAYGSICPESKQLYDDLLNLWFPLSGESPKAFVIDTAEQVLFIPDWLKLRMIRSNVPRLVDAALIGLEPHQLVLFIQSFGIPVPSMSKLLNALDVAVSDEEASVAEAVLDKSYMAQLVEVQRRRGAVGGEIFVNVLQLHEPPITEDHIRKSLFWREPLSENLVPRKRPKELHSLQVLPLLNAVFSKESYKVNIQSDFRSLIKSLALEIRSPAHTVKTCSILKLVMNYFILNRDSPSFSQSLLDESQYSSRLLRILLSNATTRIIGAFAETAKRIYIQIKDRISPVTLILKNFIDLCDKKHEPACDVEMFIKTEDPLTVLKNTDIISFERTGRCLLERGIELRSNAVLVEAIAKLLSETNYKSNSNFEPAGLLIDWLASIEPELIGSCPELQMDLMFSKTNDFLVTKRSNAFRAYLQTLLIHRAGWATLHQCIGHLLADCTTTRYDPSAVLDFLWALTRNPKLLQGRDKNPPKSYKPEDILELSHLELKSLVNYMLEEALSIDKTSHQNVKAAVNCTELRLPLLLQCIYDNPTAISCVARYLLSIIKLQEQREFKFPNQMDTVIILDDSDEKELVDTWKMSRQRIAEQFLLLMYMHVPRVIHYVMGSDRERLFQKVYLTEWSSSILDKISHCLFTALTATPHTKDWQRRSQEYDLMARKMTASHPILVLRQLPMIAASLRGRTHLDFGVFRARNHLNLFVQVLGILELLQPHVFMPEYQFGLENTLHAFFSLFRYHGRLKELLLLLNRFIVILQAYISYDAKRSLKFLQKHAHLLSDLQMTHQHLTSLRDLMTGILLPRGDADITDQDGGDVLVAVVPSAAPEQLPQNWDQIVSSLTKLQGEEVQQALQDVDHLSNRKPAILDNILQQICRLMMSPTAGIRVLAHTLLARHLKHNPSSDVVSSTAYTAILRCLDSSNSDIVITTLQRLPELVVCMQENAIPILEKAFTLGMGSDVNTATYINKTINLLNLQVGC